MSTKRKLLCTSNPAAKRVKLCKNTDIDFRDEINDNNMEHAINADRKTNEKEDVEIKHEETFTLDIDDCLINCWALKRLKNAFMEYGNSIRTDNININTIINDFIFLLPFTENNDDNFEYICKQLNESCCNTNICNIFSRNYRNRNEKK
eukprot:31250_1